MPSINVHTQLCAVIGDPVAHSLSPVLHNAAFQACDVDMVYLAFRVEHLAGCLAGMRAISSFRGLSVTIPHKMTIIPLLDDVEPMARHVGSVNTVVNEEGRLIGSTTDGAGTLRAFADAGVSLDGKRILFIGSGGAVRAVAFAFAELTQAAHITLLGRTPERVRAIVQDLQARTPMSVEGGALEQDLRRAMNSHDIVVHGTPIGMYPDEDKTAIPADTLRPDQVVFDMVYRPHRTRLIQDAEANGCTVIYGIDMLINQAALQFERWTGISAPTDIMRKAVMQYLE